MVREELKELHGKGKLSFEATFEKLSKDKIFAEKDTALLTGVTHNGKEVSDHIWIKAGKRLKKFIEKHDIKPGTRIRFTAIVVEYFHAGKRDFYTNYSLGELRSIQLAEDVNERNN